MGQVADEFFEESGTIRLAGESVRSDAFYLPLMIFFYVFLTAIRTEKARTGAYDRGLR